MDRKKIIIALLIIIVGLTSGGAYWYFSKKISQPTPGVEFPGESSTSTRPIGSVPTGEVTTTEPTLTPGSTAPLPRLYELHKLPVAGAGFIETKDKKGVVVSLATRYIERGLGYIFETPLTSPIESRIVNEIHSHISEALWGNNGKSVVIRFINDKTGGTIETHILNIAAPTISFAQSTSTESSLSDFLKTEEILLPDNIPFMAVSEDGTDQTFYLENGTSAAVGSVSTFKNSSILRIFGSSFTEWLPQFPNQKLVALTTKPSATVPGHMFFVDTKTKAVTKILGGIKGLTTLTNHDGKLVLFSETINGRPELSVYDVAKKTSRSLNIQTLPEKCAWGTKNLSIAYCAAPQSLPSADYPDQWYQGVVSFSDTIQEIDTKTFVTQKIMTPKDFGAPQLDIINPTLSSDDGYILFMNKISGTPWVYRITEVIPQKIAVPSTATATATTTKVATSTSVITSGMKKIR